MKTDLDALARLAYDANGQQQMLLYRAIAEIEVLRIQVAAYKASVQEAVNKVNAEISLFRPRKLQ